MRPGKSNHDDVPLIVEIRGELDVLSAPGLRDELLRVIRRRGPRLALDLAGVTFIDCAGIGVLLATRRRAQLEDGSVEVIRAPPRVRRIISLLGLGWALGLQQGGHWKELRDGDVPQAPASPRGPGGTGATGR
jgi:anti-anti-sigma factor